MPLETWASALVGFTGFDPAQGGFTFIPDNVDILLLGALVGYSGGGGVLNLTLSNWARDKGYGMGSRVGHIARRGGRRDAAVWPTPASSSSPTRPT